MRGSMKNLENRSSASWKDVWETSKKKFVSYKLVYAFEDPAFFDKNYLIKKVRLNIHFRLDIYLFP
jgi:hypothetical protein